MKGLLALRDQFDIAFACDTDHDRHGVVTKSAGLLPPNHYLAVCIAYLFGNRPQWRTDAAVGKTVVSSNLIDFAAGRVARSMFEVPVGFKWFVDRLLRARSDSPAKKAPALPSSAERSGLDHRQRWHRRGAARGRDRGSHESRSGRVLDELAHAAGDPIYERIDRPATPEEKSLLAALTPTDVTVSHLAGEDILKVLTTAPGNGSPIGGVKVIARSAWFRPALPGRKMCTRSTLKAFAGEEHLRLVQRDAQQMIAEVFTAARLRTSATS